MIKPEIKSTHPSKNQNQQYDQWKYQKGKRLFSVKIK